MILKSLGVFTLNIKQDEAENPSFILILRSYLYIMLKLVLFTPQVPSSTFLQLIHHKQALTLFSLFLLIIPQSFNPSV